MVFVFISVPVVAVAFVPVPVVGAVVVVFAPAAPGAVAVGLSPGLDLGALVAAGATLIAISDPATNADKASVETRDFFMVTSIGDRPLGSIGHVLS
jgi:hypothetical protein